MPRAVSTLSSTTRMRDDFRGVRPRPGCGRFRPGRRGSTAGSRTVNSLPSPGPALVAETSPPCISTSFLTTVRPIPSPPSERARERSPCANSSNILGNASGANPTPVSLTRKTNDSPRSTGRESDVAAGLGVLGRVGQEVADDLFEPGRVGVDPEVAPVEVKLQRVLPLGDQGAGGLDGVVEGRGRLDSTAAELDLAAGDPRDVEQVVDQPGEVADLAADDLHRPVDVLAGPARLGRASTALPIAASGLRSSWASMARNSSLRRSFSRNSW